VKRLIALRNILVRKPIRVFLVATMAVPGLFLAASPPASASAGSHLCESFGSYCIGAPSLGLNDPVVETASGRLIDISPVGTGNQRELAFDADPSKCVAAASNGYLAVIHPCNGGSGVVWIEAPGPSGSLTYESREFPGKYLAGDNHGDQFGVKLIAPNGWYHFAAGTLVPPAP
jgi:hypothetical protein